VALRPVTTSHRLAPVVAGGRSYADPARVQVATAVVAIVFGTALGAAVALGMTLLVVAALAAVGALVLVLLKPELLLVVWFTAILVNGRPLTFTQVGPLYITEPLLALLTFGALAGAIVHARTHPEVLEERRRALRFVVTLALVMLVPALAGIFLMTSSMDYAAGRNLLLVLYPLFAVIVVLVTDLARSWRYWFAAAMTGPVLALVLVITGHAGRAGETSTGATRIAAHTFVLAFGIAPIVLIAAARERMIRPVVTAVAALPFLVGLLLVNHRSAWIAFMAALLVLFGMRVSPAVVVGGLAVVVTGLLLLTGPVSKSAPFGQEIARAKSVTSTTDPNAKFRLTFWEAAMARSVQSPLFGNGFDAFPASIVPPEPGNPDPFPAPHNSFVAIGYRVGLFPLLVVVGLLLNLVRLGVQASKRRETPLDRAVCAALTGIVIFAGVTSAFNVFLEAPYAGPLFWTCVGLLAYAVYADPFRVRETS
jgi:O-antigen ligase